MEKRKKLHKKRRAPKENIIVYGKNTVLSIVSERALSISRISIQENLRDTRVNKIIEKAYPHKIPVETISKKKLSHLTQTESHQGICAQIAATSFTDLNTMLLDISKRPFLFVILDGIQDPHNMGATIRTAECAGASAVLIPKDNTCPINSTVYKTSSGAISYIPICRIGNVSQTIESLKKKNIWVFGSDEKAQLSYLDVDFQQSVALVIGSEGKGIRRSVAKHCDDIVKIKMNGKTSSLNASVASGILLFEALRQRTYKQK